MDVLTYGRTDGNLTPIIDFQSLEVDLIMDSLAAETELVQVRCVMELLVALEEYVRRQEMVDKLVSAISTAKTPGLFLPRDSMLARYMLRSCVGPSVCYKPEFYRND